MLSGTVSSGEDDTLLPGVSVVVKGTTAGSITNLDGEFKLSIPKDATHLVFSYVGFVTKEVEIGTQNTFDITLSPDSKLLSEVVVVGYGEQSKDMSIQNVATLGNEKFESMPVTTPQEILQGQTAGVQMSGSSGIAGVRPNVRIRGASSINAGTQPLYVVDGVPMSDGNGETTYTRGQGGTSMNPLIELNPNDIESVSVLKDAAATAIYGSRGANGVILIKTKKGKQGKTKFNFDYYRGVINLTKKRDAMTADEYRKYGKEVYNLTDKWFEDRNATGSFDWPGSIIQTGSINSYNLSASGGSEKTRYFVGGTYMAQKSYILNNGLNKLNGRVNLTHQATDKLRFGVNLGLARTKNFRAGADNSTAAPLTTAYLQLPWVMPRDENGKFVNTGFLANVFAIQSLVNNSLITRRTTGNFFAEYDLIEGLTLKTDWGIDNLQNESKSREPDVISSGGYGSKRIVQDLKYLTTNTLRFSKELDAHNFGALAGFTYETSNFYNLEARSVRFVSDLFPNVFSGAEKTRTEETGTKWALWAIFSQFNYRYNNKYLAEFSLRRDGSSRFGKNKKWGVFWAMSAGWILSKEKFMSNLSFVDYLKLSASYGTSGNDRIGNFDHLGLYGNAAYDANPGIQPTQPANLDLTWEETAQLDVTLNARLFSERLTLELSWYKKDVSKMLLNVPLPYTTGFSESRKNFGEMTNTGIDLNIKSVNLEKSGFVWETTFNLGTLKNELTKLPRTTLDEDGVPFVGSTASQRAILGHTINSFYLPRYKGVNPETGDAEWLTRDGEVTTTPRSSDRVLVGSALPKFTGGITNTFRFKGFTLSAFFNFVQGSKVYLGEYSFTDHPGRYNTFNLSPRLLDYWKKPGDNSYSPSPKSKTFQTFASTNSTFHLKDASFIRLKNISLSYNVPANILEKTKVISKAQLYIMGHNMLTFTAKDFPKDTEPEVSRYGTNSSAQGESFFTTPQVRTITMGVRLGF